MKSRQMMEDLAWAIGHRSQGMKKWDMGIRRGKSSFPVHLSGWHWMQRGA